MNRLFTVPETMQRVPLSKSSMYRGIRTGEIPSITVAGRILIPEAWVDGLILAAIDERTDVETGVEVTQ
jgi:predicted DNA-binding transcriptional regulator AlpA